MIPTVMVNKLTVVHKNSDGVVVCGCPDVCLTPSGSGPVPVAYTNTAFSKDLVNGTTTVSADGQSIAVKDSKFGTSYGDEGGTAGGGVASGKIKGAATFTTYSMDVFAEGRNIARLSDQMIMNGNSYNTGGVESQGNRLPENLDDVLCIIFCWCNDGNDGGGLFNEVPYTPNIA